MIGVCGCGAYNSTCAATESRASVYTASNPVLADQAFNMRSLVAALQLYLALGGLDAIGRILRRMDERDDEVGFLVASEMQHWASERNITAAASARAAGLQPPAPLRLPSSLNSRFMRMLVQSPFFRHLKLGSSRVRLCPRHPHAGSVLALAAQHARGFLVSLQAPQSHEASATDRAFGPEMLELLGAHPLGPQPLDWVVDPWVLRLLDACRPVLRPPPTASESPHAVPWQPVPSTGLQPGGEFSCFTQWEGQPVGPADVASLAPVLSRPSVAVSSSSVVPSIGYGADSSSVYRSSTPSISGYGTPVLSGSGWQASYSAASVMPPAPGSAFGGPRGTTALPQPQEPLQQSFSYLNAAPPSAAGVGTEFSRRLQAQSSSAGFFARPEDIYASDAARLTAGAGASLASGVRARAVVVPSRASGGGVEQEGNGYQPESKRRRVEADEPEAAPAPPAPVPYTLVTSLQNLREEVDMLYASLATARGHGSQPGLSEAALSLKCYTAPVPDSVNIHRSASKAGGGDLGSRPSDKPVPRHRVCLIALTLHGPAASLGASSGSQLQSRTLLIDPIAMGEAYASARAAAGTKSGGGAAVLLPARRAGSGEGSESSRDRANDDAIAHDSHVMTLLEPLLRPLLDPRLLKVTHGGHSDVMWLGSESGQYIANVFDSFVGIDELLLRAAARAEPPAQQARAAPVLSSSFVTTKHHELATLALTPSLTVAAAAAAAASLPGRRTDSLAAALTESASAVGKLGPLSAAIDAILGPFRPLEGEDVAAHYASSAAMQTQDWQVRPLPALALHRAALDSSRVLALAGAVWTELASPVGGGHSTSEVVGKLESAAATAASSASASEPALLAAVRDLQQAYSAAPHSPTRVPLALDRACMRSHLLCLRSPPFDVDHGGTMRVPICAPPWYSSCRVCGGRGHFYTQCAQS